MKRCDLCGLPLLAWQTGRHLSCCVLAGGRDPQCNPVRAIWYDDEGRGYRPCAACWRLGPFIKMKPAPKAAAKPKRRAA